MGRGGGRGGGRRRGGGRGGRGGRRGGRGGGRGGRGRDGPDQRDFLKFDGVMNVSTEHDVGIRAVIGSNSTIVASLPPDQCFTGVLKHRYTDFQVHEIDLNGKTIVLDNLPKPAEGNKRRRKQQYLGYSGISNLDKEYMERSTSTWRQYLCGTFATDAMTQAAAAAQAYSEAASSSSSSSSTTTTSAATTATAGTATADVVPNFKRSRVPLPNQNQALAQHTKSIQTSFVRSTKYTRHLVGKTPPIKPKPTLTAEEEITIKELAELQKNDTYALSLKSMLLNGQDQTEGASKGESYMILPATEDRDYRRTIHLLLKKLPKTIIADTIADPNGTEGKSIRIRVNSKKQKGQRGANKRNREEHGVFDTRGNQETWPTGKPDYISFLLYKENIDTQSAISKLCQSIGCRPKLFAYAGTKDKRAVTCQRVTAYRVLPNTLLRVNRTNFRGQMSSNIAVSDIDFCEKPLRLGMLQGNAFSIVLRDAKSMVAAAAADAAGAAGAVATGAVANVAESSEPPTKKAKMDPSSTSSTSTTPTSSTTSSSTTIETAEYLQKVVDASIHTLRESGFINYFGLQRFGTGAVPTHIVGKALLKKEYSKAVELILKARLGSHSKLMFEKAFKC